MLGHETDLRACAAEPAKLSNVRLHLPRIYAIRSRRTMTKDEFLTALRARMNATNEANAEETEDFLHEFARLSDAEQQQFRNAVSDFVQRRKTGTLLSQMLGRQQWPSP